MKDSTFKGAKNLIIFTLALLSIASSNLAWAECKSTETKIKEKIDDAADALKRGVDKCGEKAEDIQNYLHNYDYKGVIQERVKAGIVTVSDIMLNGHRRAVVVKPGERIEGKLRYTLDKEHTKDAKLHHLVLGFKGCGPRTAISLGLGYLADRENETNFTLIAPAKPGFYQIRFRPVEGYFETQSRAEEKWTDDQGQEPDAKTTVGFVVVKS